jgi:hypothetical protein
VTTVLVVYKPCLLAYNMEVGNLLKDQLQQAARYAARKESLLEVFDMCFELNYPQATEESMMSCFQLYAESKKITERAFAEYVKSQSKKAAPPSNSTAPV